MKDNDVNLTFFKSFEIRIKGGGFDVRKFKDRGFRFCVKLNDVLCGKGFGWNENFQVGNALDIYRVEFKKFCLNKKFGSKI